MYRECGLFIHETKQFQRASPDLLVECSCCGKGILEAKCPFCIAERAFKKLYPHRLKFGIPCEN